jgi:hypothetical protein
VKQHPLLGRGETGDGFEATVLRQVEKHRGKPRGAANSPDELGLAEAGLRAPTRDRLRGRWFVFRSAAERVKILENERPRSRVDHRGAGGQHHPPLSAIGLGRRQHAVALRQPVRCLPEPGEIHPDGLDLQL